MRLSNSFLLLDARRRRICCHDAEGFGDAIKNSLGGQAENSTLPSRFILIFCISSPNTIAVSNIPCRSIPQRYS